MRFLVLLTLLVACGDDSAPADTGARDLGSRDTGARDGALPVDAAGDGATDATIAGDGSTPVDMGVVDGGPAGSLCPAAQDCNPVTGLGCMDGEGCYLGNPAGGGDTTASCSMAGAGALGEPCSAVNACAPHLSCVGGACSAMCCGDRDEDCPSGFLCAGRTTLEGVGYCIATNDCDLLAQTGCDGGEGCYPFGESDTRCRMAGSAGPREACEGSSDCQSGLLCLSDGFCHRFCDPSAPSTCADMDVCSDLTGFDVGVCTTPDA